jgi:ATP-dependent DNA helicase RecG
MKEIIPKNESETVEFKSAFNSDTVETLVAFANSKGGFVYTEPSLIPDVEEFTIDSKKVVIFSDGLTISTDLVTEVEEVLAFIRKHISKEYIITANPAREERWDYPLDALREIVMNMVVHRDYTHRGNSSVKIFPNRIEFFNPGKLPSEISVNDLIEGKYVSDCRNKLIAKVFKEIDWIERYGSGIKRIMNFFKDYGSPNPVFENFQHGFRITVFSIVENIVKKDTEKDTEKELLSNNQKKILEKISENKLITAEELVDIVGINLRNVKANLSKLKAKGLLERVGSDKGGYWKV